MKIWTEIKAMFVVLLKKKKKAYFTADISWFSNPDQNFI